jgi:hypothetical protein
MGSASSLSNNVRRKVTDTFESGGGFDIETTTKIKVLE